MAAPMTANSMRIISKETEFISGLTAETTKVNGRIIRWRAMVCSHGLMAEDMKENISMIKKKVKEFFTGQMEESMKVTGKMANNTE